MSGLVFQVSDAGFLVLALKGEDWLGKVIFDKAAVLADSCLRFERLYSR